MSYKMELNGFQLLSFLSRYCGRKISRAPIRRFRAGYFSHILEKFLLTQKPGSFVHAITQFLGVSTSDIVDSETCTGLVLGLAHRSRTQLQYPHQPNNF